MNALEQINREEFSVAISATLNEELCRHLLRDDEQEDVAFALYKPSTGALRFTAVIYKIVLPEEGDRDVHGNVEIQPGFFQRVCRMAMSEQAGIVLLHSHLGPGWQGMSPDDFITERGYSAPSFTLTDLPFVGLTLGTDQAWSARLWQYTNGWHEQRSAASIRVVGKALRVSYDDRLRPRPEYKNIYKRTITVWGEHNHAHLARLRVGIIGLGSVGSMVAESLARMGVERFVLVDFDEVQEHNLDRLLGATVHDIGHAKALVTQRQIHRASTATNPQIRPVLYGVTEEQGYLNALDCDILFSCVDRPWPRHVLNHLAYNHLIPVIDGGILVKLNSESGQFEEAVWQAQSVGPERPCLQCLRLYGASDVATEQAGLLDDSSYIEGLPADHAFRRNENIFPFSANLASLEVLQFIEQVTSIAQVDYFGTQRFSYRHGSIRVDDEQQCQEGCLFQQGIGLADSQFPPPYQFDYSADIARKRQETGKTV
jgi:hypothetical protein